jgi:SpoVK/Ycf46/Vps4 family AAA+-type ATPase
MSLTRIIIYPTTKNKSLDDMGMYFYGVEADCQDRDLEINVEPINMMRVADLQESIIEDNVCMNVNVSILTRMNAALSNQKPVNTETKPRVNDARSANAPLAKVINIADSFKLPAPSQLNNSNNSSVTAMNKSASMQKEQKNPLIEKIDALFSDFVGMSHLKEEVYRQASFIKIQQMRKEKNIAVAASPSRHMVFKGSPGTGKTTVARVIADVYHELGVLDTNNVVETDRSGLIAEYLGQTAVKTREVIESAIGGVLFIDEAYSLTEQSNDYGSEAIDMLLKMMEDHRNNLVVIVAGYGDEMDSFIASNPGLSSRFNRYMDFPDYSEEELWEILLKLCKANSYIIQDQTQLKSRMLKEFKLQKLQQGEYFGNARYVRNLFEKAIENQSYRLIMESATDYVSLQALQQCDFLAE